MPKPFRGKIDVDIKRSVPDWEPFVRVAIDISGEPFADLAREPAALYASR